MIPVNHFQRETCPLHLETWRTEDQFHQIRWAVVADYDASNMDVTAKKLQILQQGHTCSTWQHRRSIMSLWIWPLTFWIINVTASVTHRAWMLELWSKNVLCEVRMTLIIDYQIVIISWIQLDFCAKLWGIPSRRFLRHTRIRKHDAPNHSCPQHRGMKMENKCHNQGKTTIQTDKVMCSFL